MLTKAALIRSKIQ